MRGWIVCQVFKLSADISYLKSKDPEPFNFAGIIQTFKANIPKISQIG